jgi:hypothetical protein
MACDKNQTYLQVRWVGDWTHRTCKYMFIIEPQSRVRNTELYYITGGPDGQKKLSKKHGGFRPLLTPFPWELVRTWSVLKKDITAFSRLSKSIFKMFSRYFVNLVIGSKMSKLYVLLLFPGKTTNKYSNLAKYEQRGYLNQRAINRYFIQFYLCFIYLISDKISRLNLSLTMKRTLFVKKTAFCLGFLV